MQGIASGASTLAMTCMPDLPLAMTRATLNRHCERVYERGNLMH